MAKAEREIEALEGRLLALDTLAELQGIIRIRTFTKE